MKFRNPLLVAAVAALALFAVPSLEQRLALADTPNIAVAMPGVVLMPLQLSGQYTADRTAVVKLKLPFPARVLGVSATARASGGTTPTLTVDVLDDGTSILAAPIAVTAGTVAEGTVDTPAIADESVVTVNLAITGTSPTWDDITILVTLVRT